MSTGGPSCQLTKTRVGTGAPQEGQLYTTEEYCIVLLVLYYKVFKKPGDPDS